MPTIAAPNLSRTSSVLFFELGAKAYESRRDDASAAGAAVVQRLDHYIAGDRAHALARGERLFRQCLNYGGDPSTRVAVWAGAVHCMERHAPDYALARDMAPLAQLPSENALAALVDAEVANFGGPLSAQQLRRYVSAPLLGFLQSLDFASVWALGLCSSASADEVQQLHRLLQHPGIHAALELNYPLFVQLLEADAGSDTDDGSDGALENSPGSLGEMGGEATAGSDVCDSNASDDDGSGDDASDGYACGSDGMPTAVQTQASRMLEVTLLELGFDRSIYRDVRDALAQEGVAEEALLRLQPALLDTAKVYAAHVAGKITASMSLEAVESLAALVRQPLCARWLCEPAEAVSGALAPVLKLVSEGAMVRSRKRLRDDATDCPDEVRLGGLG